MLRLIIYLSFALVSFVVVSSTNCSITENEYEGLVALFENTHGDDWKWNQSEPDTTHWTFPSAYYEPCSNHWQGLQCEITTPGECSIVSLNLVDYNLRGNIPFEIGKLNSIRNISLARNNLTETIPSSFGYLTSLVSINLDLNFLNGSLPSELFQISTLIECIISNNHILGPLPSTLGNSVALRSLSLNMNDIGEELPSMLGNITTLTSLNLTGNNFFGSIPVSFSQLVSLEVLNIGYNKIVGTLPSAINLMTSLRELVLTSNLLTGPWTQLSLPRLEVLVMFENLIKGEFPTSYCYLPSLKQLDLSKTLLSGTLPTCVGSMIHLSDISLAFNNMNGSLPTQVGMLTAAISIDFANNHFHGFLPTQFGHLTNVSLLYLDNNQFSGTLISEIGSMKKLSFLVLDVNAIKGSIPTVFGQLRLLHTLYLNFNQLTGSIPTQLGDCTGLTTLFLGANSLTGTIPTEIGKMKYLYDLDVGINFFNGTLPSTFNNLKYLSVANFKMAKFTGNISNVFCNCSLLSSLNLGNNELTGRLPDCLGVLNMTNFWVNNNKFTGRFPRSYGNWTALEQLNIAFNSFSGEIPSIIGFWSSLVELYLNNNQFHGTIPISIANATGLGVLDFSFTSIDGTIPAILGDLIRLQYLNISNTGLVGPIPPSFSKFRRLKIFDLNSNSLTGPIPADIGLNLGLNYFSVSSNLLTGSLPEELTINPGLSDFEVGNNFLSGSNPLQLGVGSNLQYLVLSNNSFTGSLPRNWSHYHKLQYIYYDNNFVTGPLPYQFVENSHNYNSSTLLQFGISSNLLSGSLTPALFTHENMNFLGLNDNILTGSIPSEFSQLRKLANLDLSGNKLTGNLEVAFVQSFPNLEYINLGNNSFNGNLPSQLFDSSNLEVVTLSSNCFSGPIPETICTSSKLVFAIMDSMCTGTSCAANIPNLLEPYLKGVFPVKKMSGGIPSCLWTLPKLESLQLSGNGLVGALPIGTPPVTMSTLQLSYNAFTGTIPTGLQERGGFQFFSLQHNRLTGTISENFNISSSFAANQTISYTTLYLDVNRLSGDIPASFSELDTVSVLSGNLFACTDVDSLPPNDPNSRTYECGSTQMNTALYAWVALFGALVILILVYLVIIYFSSNISSLLNQRTLSVEPNELLNVRLRETLNTSSIVEATLSTTLTTAIAPSRSNVGQMSMSKLSYASSPFDRMSSLSLASSSNPELNRSTVVSETRDSVKTMNVVVIENHPRKANWTRTIKLKLREIGSTVIRVFLKTVQWLSFNYSSRRNYLVNTRQFLEVIWRASRGMFGLSVMYLGICMTFYLLLKSYGDNYSTIYHQYGWISTVSYIHGYVPACFLLAFVVISLIIMVNSVRTDALTSLANQRSIARENWKATKYYSALTIPTFAQFYDYFVVPLVLHTINIVVTVTANAVYVSVLLDVGPSVILFFQAAMSLFKLSWANIYIPFAMEYMKLLPTTILLRHHVAMLIFNYIIGPGFASSGADSDCFYPAIVGSGTVSSTFNRIQTVQTCTTTFEFIPSTNIDLSEVTIDCSFVPTTIITNTQTTPPFIYGYQCGSSFIVDYVPVLLYSYLFSSIVLPLFRFFVLHLSRASVKKAFPGYMYKLFISDSLLDCDDAIMGSIEINALGMDNNKSEERILSSGGDPLPGISMLPRDRVISGANGMSTFIAATSTASRSASVNAGGFEKEKPLFDGLTVIAKRILDFAVILTFGMACLLLAVGIAFSVYANAVVWRLMIGKFLSSVGEKNTYAFFRLEKSSEGLVRGAVAGLGTAVIAICLFWSVILFDMVADIHGDKMGMVFVIVMLVVVPMSLLIGFSLQDYFTPKTMAPPTIPSPTTTNDTNAEEDPYENYEADGSRNPIHNGDRVMSVDIWAMKGRKTSTMADVDHNSQFL